MAKTDLSDFFHSFRVEPWLLPFFAMPAVRAGDVGAVGCEADSMVFPCLATVPIGWNWSVLCTQEAHRFVLYSRASARKQDELGAPDKVINRPRHGLYVDDFMQLVTEPALPRARRLRGGVPRRYAGCGLGREARQDDRLHFAPDRPVGHPL